MIVKLLTLFSLLAASSIGVVIDRIAVRVDNAIIKESDISRNIRVTDFLNDHQLQLNSASRKEAVKRLIDQVFIREEIRVGDYPRAEWSEADQQLDALKKERFKVTNSFTQTLSRYGLTEADLRFEFHWQLTVLRFIDARFRPAVLVSDSEIDSYYRQHAKAFRAGDGSTAPLDDVQDDIRETITGDKVNEQFFAWLDGKRKSNKIIYYEEELR